MLLDRQYNWILLAGEDMKIGVVLWQGEETGRVTGDHKEGRISLIRREVEGGVGRRGGVPGW